MNGISQERVEKIVREATRGGGTVYVPSPKHTLETNHGYGGLQGNPSTVEELVAELHASAVYWLDMGSEVERAEGAEIGRLENWIAREAREWALEHA